jgi:GNAT superfamily N-acetyltransferase
MSDDIQVRAIRREDYDAWLPLWQGYNAFYGRSGETAVAPEITAATWGRFFDAYEPVWALVAAQEGRLVGLVHYLFHRVTNRVEPVCYLEDLFTAEAARGRGVGRALIEAVYEEAKAAGVTRVYWQTQETNATAMRLYDQVAEKSGFIVYGREV